MLNIALGFFAVQSEWSTNALEAAETSMSQPSPNQQRSLAVFLAEKARFDAMVAEAPAHERQPPRCQLRRRSLGRGQVGDLQHWNSLLARVADAYHRRGEFAA